MNLYWTFFKFCCCKINVFVGKTFFTLYVHSFVAVQTHFKFPIRHYAIRRTLHLICVLEQFPAISAIELVHSFWRDGDAGLESPLSLIGDKVGVLGL